MNHHHHHPRTNLSGHYPDAEETPVREIHAVQPFPPQRREPWDTSSQVSYNSLSMASDNFTTMSHEFNALVVAGSAIENVPPAVENHHHQYTHHVGQNNMILGMIGERRDYEIPVDTNPLALNGNMPPLAPPERAPDVVPSGNSEVSMRRVKEEEVETKITAFEKAKVAKVNNRFKTENAIISGWENARVEKASASLKKVERKLEEKRARALEKMQNDVAKACRKAEEKRASAEAKRGTKVAKVLEISKLMRALGRDPSKRSFLQK